MLKASYEIPDEKLLMKYNCQGIEFEGLLNETNSQLQIDTLNESIVQKFDIDSIKKDTKGHKKFNAKKHIRNYMRKFKRMWVKFQKQKMKVIDKKLSKPLKINTAQKKEVNFMQSAILEKKGDLTLKSQKTLKIKDKEGNVKSDKKIAYKRSATLMAKTEDPDK